MGAIYHSQPVVVGPPREFVRDESYDVFATEQASRPTVVYAATIDGQLHAFLLGDNTARLEEHEATQADIDTENNELWSFVPPMVLPYLSKNVNKHALLLDGGITVKNVAYERTATALAGTAAEYVDLVKYRTAMVVSSGNSSTIPGGGYYFALDVTDPHPDDEDFDGDVDPGGRFEAPKFLWQLSRTASAATVDDESGDDDEDTDADGNDNPTSLFGEALPAAAITSIAYAPNEGEPVREVAVAILAGGRSPAPDTMAFENFDYESLDLWDGPDEVAPRNRVRRWGTSRADRSLTIVRLDTGEIIRRFVGQAGDPGVDADRTETVGFWAPISGTPVAFPGLPGQVSSRVFVGDAEGMLWAIDLTSPDPEDWEMKVAWDPYRGVTDEDDEGVEIGPVETVPVVSVNEVGDPVVVFATGSQESFYERRGTNFVVSLRDDPTEEGYELNWELDLATTPDLGSAVFAQDDPMTTVFKADGQRVTGPINIFDGVVYFSTFVPSGEACEVGTSRVWGVHYVDHDEEMRPLAAWDPDGNGDDDFFEQDDTAIIFGVAIGQQPSCDNTSEEVIDDPVFGRYTTFSSSPPGGFELVVQTGRQIGGATAATGEPTTRTRRWALRPPVSSVRVDGWASIVE
jgi:type IV pilus assembly protein PilY1